jgi:hypothetical protein
MSVLCLSLLLVMSYDEIWSVGTPTAIVDYNILIHSVILFMP